MKSLLYQLEKRVRHISRRVSLQRSPFLWKPVFKIRGYPLGENQPDPLPLRPNLKDAGGVNMRQTFHLQSSGSRKNGLNIFLHVSPEYRIRGI